MAEGARLLSGYRVKSSIGGSNPLLSSWNRTPSGYAPGGVRSFYAVLADGASGRTQVVALPLSRTQIEKLGKRLAATDRPSVDDLELFNELLVAHRHVLTAAVERVEMATGCKRARA